MDQSDTAEPGSMAKSRAGLVGRSVTRCGLSSHGLALFASEQCGVLGASRGDREFDVCRGSLGTASGNPARRFFGRRDLLSGDGRDRAIGSVARGELRTDAPDGAVRPDTSSREGRSSEDTGRFACRHDDGLERRAHGAECITGRGESRGGRTGFSRWTLWGSWTDSHHQEASSAPRPS